MMDLTKIKRFNSLEELVKSYAVEICGYEMDAVLIGWLPNDTNSIDWCAGYLIYARDMEAFKFENWLNTNAGWGGYDEAFNLLETDPKTIKLGGTDIEQWEQKWFQEVREEQTAVYSRKDETVKKISELVEKAYFEGKGVTSLGMACDYAPSIFLVDYIRAMDTKMQKMPDSKREEWKAKKAFIIERRTNEHKREGGLGLCGGYMRWVDFLLSEKIDGAEEMRNSPCYTPDNDWY